MPFNAYLVIRDADADGAGRLDLFYRTRNEAVARAGTDAALSAHASEVAAPDRVASGWWFDGTDTLTSDRPFTAAESLDARRLEVVLNLIDQEDLPQLAIWGALDPERAKGYSRWVEVNTGALLIDNNLTNDSLYAKLRGESQIPKRFWYHAYNVENWFLEPDGFYRESLSPGDAALIHYVTTAGGTEPDTRMGVASGLALPGAGWSWQVELAKYRDGITIPLP